MIGSQRRFTHMLILIVIALALALLALTAAAVVVLGERAAKGAKHRLETKTSSSDSPEA